ncbi:MAG: serine protease [Acidobacteriota bacterium]
MIRPRWSLALLVALVWSASVTTADDAGSPAVDPFVDLTRHASAVVSVRYLAEVRAPGVDREVDNTVRCLIIDTEGWVLCSNTELGAYFTALTRLMGHSSAPITIRPKDIRVLLDGRELTARLVARDSDRDLAWLTIEDLPEDLELTALDLAGVRAEAVPAVGQPLYLLRRLDEFFGEVPAVSEARVAALPTQPRALIVPAPTFGDIGMPVFDRNGRLVGVTIVQVPGDEDSSVVMNDRQRALPGQAGPIDDMVAIVLPIAEVLEATALARDVWAADQHEQLD